MVGEILDEPLVEVDEPNRGLDLFLVPWYGPFHYTGNLGLGPSPPGLPTQSPNICHNYHFPPQICYFYYPHCIFLLQTPFNTHPRLKVLPV